MSNLGDFLHMGGYGFYVWTSYGITLLVLLINALQPVWQRRRLLVSIARGIRRARREKP